MKKRSVVLVLFSIIILLAVQSVSAVCGDGVLDINESETCDDNNNLNGDGCSETCELEYISNLVLDVGTSVSSKASQSSVNTLQSSVNSLTVDTSTRASQTSVTNIQDILSNPDDFKADISNLNAQITSRASVSQVEVVEQKIDALEFPDVSALATQSTVDAIEVKLDNQDNFKADVSRLSTQESVNLLFNLINNLDIPDISGLATQSSVGAIEAKLDLPDDFKADVTDLATQVSLDDLHTKVDAIMVPQDTASQISVDAIEAKLDDPSFGLQAIIDWLSPIMGTVARIELALDDVKTVVDQTSTQQSVDELNTKVDALESKLDNVQLTLEQILDQVATTIPPRCGNGDIETGESCDDGNNINGDGCSATCMIESCSDGKLDVGEQCDDGNNVIGDGCSAACVLEDCSTDIDCSPKEFCNAQFMCELLNKDDGPIEFRTNIEAENYFACTPLSECWIGVDTTDEPGLEIFGFWSKSNSCDGGTMIAQTPSGLSVYEYGVEGRVRICDLSKRQVIFSSRVIPDTFEASKHPTEPYTGNDQETFE